MNVSSVVLRLMAVLVAFAAACSADGPGPTGPSMPAAPIDPARAAELQAHVDDPFFQAWLPGYLGDQEDAQPIRALARAISADLAAGDAVPLRASLLAVPAALDGYRQLPGHAARDETILDAIDLYVRGILAILDEVPNRSNPLSQDRG